MFYNTHVGGIPVEQHMYTCAELNKPTNKGLLCNNPKRK